MKILRISDVHRVLERTGGTREPVSSDSVSPVASVSPDSDPSHSLAAIGWHGAGSIRSCAVRVDGDTWICWRAHRFR